MTVVDHLVDQRFKQYESRLMHIDELMRRASQGVIERPEFADELSEIRREREALLKDLNSIKRRSQEEWQSEEIEQAGPMVIWDAVAKRLEKLVEKIEQ